VDRLYALSVFSGCIVGIEGLRPKSYISHRFVVSLLDERSSHLYLTLVLYSLSLPLSLPLSLSLSLNHLPTIVLIEIHPAVRQDAYTSIPSRRTRLS
jgi:hypothetical protein